MKGELTKAQRAMLSFYAASGPTWQGGAKGSLNTWKSLIRRGLLSRSRGPGAIETEITPAGRAALSSSGGQGNG